MKFGGTSVAGSDQLRRIVPIVRQVADKQPVVVVVSAFRGVTDALLSIATDAASGKPWEGTWHSIAHQHRRAADELGLLPWRHGEALLEELHDFATGIALLGECTPRMLDAIAAYGELLSSRLLEGFLAQSDEVAWYDARTSIITDACFTNAHVDWERTKAATCTTLNPLLERYRTIVTQGFIASTAEGVTTTLGRGGSDYSAALLGAALGADSVEIWTDVSGIYTADPRVIPDARSLPNVTIGEIRTLAAYGAKVLHPLTIEPAIEYDVPVVVRNTFEPSHPGTVIVSRLDSPTDGIRALAMLDAYRSTDSNALLEDGQLLASVHIRSERYQLVQHALCDRDIPATLICCVGEGIHRTNRALEQIIAASNHAGCAVTIVGSGANSLLVSVERNWGTRFLRALHETMCHQHVEVTA
ncbi:MAG: hypothetical protein KatS3mg038_1054 [Candidatus Kapaibacterium sp.]|nr:MAG: hypothetical protein KatS3mg038_1054 [Candidatus Kapabacteria bacterium]